MSMGHWWNDDRSGVALDTLVLRPQIRVLDQPLMIHDLYFMTVLYISWATVLRPLFLLVNIELEQTVPFI
jgi:hypothetical protein